MSGVDKRAALLIALFGAVPVGLITALITMELFDTLTGIAITPAAQQFTSWFAGLAYGMATFVFLYNARRAE